MSRIRSNFAWQTRYLKQLDMEIARVTNGKFDKIDQNPYCDQTFRDPASFTKWSNYGKPSLRGKYIH